MNHSLKLLTAIAASVLVATIVAGFALANGSSSGARVKIAKTKLGRILVDSRGITLYDFVKDKGGRAPATAPAPRSGLP